MAVSAPSHEDIHRRITLDQRECDLMVRRHELYVLSRAGGQRANFAYRNLTGLNLACKNLHEADFTGAIMVECDLSGTNLTRALLFCSNLTKAKMVRVNLTRADLRGACLKGADLTAAGMFNADLREGQIFTKRLASDLEGVRVDPDPSDMSRVKLVNANLSQAHMSGSVAAMADFTDSILKGANLAKANLTNAVMEGADLEGADLSRADLRGAVLRNANLYGATFLAADRTGADDTGALTDAPRGKPMSLLKESLHTLIRDHQSWVETGGAQGKALDVSGFDLRDIEWPEHALLTSLKAAGACLAHARIKGGWLQAGNFEGADLQRGFPHGGFAPRQSEGRQSGAREFREFEPRPAGRRLGARTRHAARPRGPAPCEVRALPARADLVPRGGSALVELRRLRKRGRGFRTRRRPALRRPAARARAAEGGGALNPRAELQRVVAEALDALEAITARGFQFRDAEAGQSG
jgi:uncharacterized protein YjbI with pentapeptide repeats